MRAVRSLVVAILAFVVLAAPAVVLADGRVALVVGTAPKEFIVKQQGIAAMLIACWLSSSVHAQTFARVETQGRFNQI